MSRTRWRRQSRPFAKARPPAIQRLGHPWTSSSAKARPSTTSAARSIDGASRPTSSPVPCRYGHDHDQPLAAAIPKEGTPLMASDPLDQQLVEAVLTRPRRGRADLEEAKLAGIRSRDVDEDETEDSFDEAEGPAATADADGDDDVAVEVVEDGEAQAARLPADAPAK